MENNGPRRLVDGPCAGRDVRARLGHILVWWVGGIRERESISSGSVLLVDEAKWAVPNTRLSRFSNNFQTAVTSEGICWTLGMDDALLLPISCCLPEPKTAGHRLPVCCCGCCCCLPPRDKTLEKEQVLLRLPFVVWLDDGCGMCGRSGAGGGGCGGRGEACWMKREKDDVDRRP